MEIGDTVECIKKPMGKKIYPETTPLIVNHNKVVQSLSVGKQYVISKTLWNGKAICVDGLWVSSALFKLV